VDVPQWVLDELSEHANDSVFANFLVNGTNAAALTSLLAQLAARADQMARNDDPGLDDFYATEDQLLCSLADAMSLAVQGMSDEQLAAFTTDWCGQVAAWDGADNPYVSVASLLIGRGSWPDSDYKPGITFRQEYERQLQLQQDGTNDLTVAEWQYNIDQYSKPASEGGGRIGAAEQRAARVQAGGVPDDGTAILHGPDQGAGGRPDVFDELGDSGINSSIGAQWTGNVRELEEDVRVATAGISDDVKPFIRMNVVLAPQ
jgi:hypothetical protein